MPLKITSPSREVAVLNRWADSIDQQIRKLNTHVLNKAGFVNTSPKTPPSTSGTSAPDIEEILINYQTGTTYVVQDSDRDTLISVSNNSGGVIYLPGTSAGGTFVQVVYSGGSTLTMTNTAPNMVILAVKFIASVLGTPTVTDTNGNVWHHVVGTVEGTGGGQPSHLLYAYNVKSGSNTITPLLTGSSVAAIWAFEYSGMPLTASLNQQDGYNGVGTSTPPITPIITNGVNRALVFAALIGGTPYTPMVNAGAGWTLRYNSGGNQLFEDQIATGIGTTSQGTTDASASFVSSVNLIASFQTTSAQAVPFVYGWFCYIENTGSGNFYLDPQGKTIDGITTPVLIGPNQGLLLVFDGINWATCRGMGSSGGGSTTMTAVEINTVGVSSDKQFFVNGVTDGASVWSVQINGASG